MRTRWSSARTRPLQCLGLKSTSSCSPGFGAPTGRSCPPSVSQRHRLRGPSCSDSRMSTSSELSVFPLVGPPRAKLSCWACSFRRRPCSCPSRPVPSALCGPQCTTWCGREEASFEAEVRSRRSAPELSSAPDLAPARAPVARRTRSARGSPPAPRPPAASCSGFVLGFASGVTAPRSRTSPTRLRAPPTPALPVPALTSGSWLAPQISRGGSVSAASPVRLAHSPAEGMRRTPRNRRCPHGVRRTPAPGAGGAPSWGGRLRTPKCSWRRRT